MSICMNRHRNTKVYINKDMHISINMSINKGIP